MTLELAWPEIALRLGLAFIAGAVIGFNREEHGRPAGLRTTVLVCLAAAGAMVLGNRLIDTTGRPADSFVTMDVMRLPLGILTGVGFIGAGAILHKGNFVVGVTTAATLWFSTVMGFCFGAGEHGLGLSLLALGVIILWTLKWIEDHWMNHTSASVTMMLGPEAGPPEQILRILRQAGYHCSPLEMLCNAGGRELHFEIRHPRGLQEEFPGDLIEHLSSQAGVKEFRWKSYP